MRLLAGIAALAAAVFAVIFFWLAEAPNAAHTQAVPSSRSAKPEAELFPCTVTKVHDGDGPIWCAEGPKLRLTAIAAREMDETCSPGHPCPSVSGAEAQRELESLATGHVLQCEKTGTSYKRVTA